MDSFLTLKRRSDKIYLIRRFLFSKRLDEASITINDPFENVLKLRQI